MNEERQDTYNRLIAALQTCGSGEEEEILNDHPDLLDVGLMKTIRIEAKKLAEMGDENGASRLRSLVVLVATAMGNSSTTPKEQADRFLEQGNEQYKMSQFEAAIKSLQEARTIYREIGDFTGEAYALNNLGEVYRQQGKYYLAIDCYQQSIAINPEKENSSSIAACLNNLGLTYESLGQYQKAIEYHKQSLAIKREIGDQLGMVDYVGNLGLAYQFQGKYQQSIEYHKEQLKIARKISYRLGEAAARNNLGLAWLRFGKLEDAKNALFKGIQVWERLRLELDDSQKISIFEEQSRTYRLLQEVLIAQNQPRKALKIAERGRARAFVELLVRCLTTNHEEKAQANSLEQMIPAPTLNKIKQIAQEQKATIVEYSIIYDRLTESKLYIWVVKLTGKVEFRSVDISFLREQHNTTLSDLVIQTRESLEAPQKRRDAPRLLQQLHKILIQPIANLLPDNPEDSVIFIPQESLFLVPFPALQDPTTGKFLIEQHTILTTPSIQVLDLTGKRRQYLKDEWASNKDEKKSDFYLVVGNPTMPSIAPEIGQSPKQLEQLEGAEAQARTIAKLFNTQPIIGNKATKLKIVQQMLSARLIHLATHGLLDDIRELGVPGAIALAPTEGIDNGFLTAGEILELTLKAELVVLSACLTGLGKITGDGVIGLSRCLFLAGVPSVIVSLWSVPDEPTQYLMTEFYDNYLGGMNKAKALRQAVLTTKQKYRSPFNWAGFTLIGESE